ncbi:hypothetical protein M501DRAFT_993709 [Patellaria atrata CBS 101060]|uniref:STE24 endopeptidase n=1 Tax=Patellaria atrata CBS 101060 TaxID=1346257 RepID=A0A9P4VUW9_9PEZI|nr:hypothetical protein M501DRAFT_993709 [Patellaria atrata CBS 101060]
MPTPLDRALNSKNAFLAFSGVIAAAAAWTIWGPSDIFPAERDPTGDPGTWTLTELRRWLENRNLIPNGETTREELIERVKTNMRPPPRS